MYFIFFFFCYFVFLSTSRGFSKWSFYKNMDVNVAIALGANLGNRMQNINASVKMLEDCGLRQVEVSPFLESAPVDCPEGSGVFINGALIGLWDGSCEELLSTCQKIEISLGRAQKRAINSPRSIDLDILLYGSEIYNSAHLTVPHLRMCERFFVMKPLFEIAPDWIIPTYGRTVREIFSELEP